jgi:hypothetical protein
MLTANVPAAATFLRKRNAELSPQAIILASLVMDEVYCNGGCQDNESRRNKPQSAAALEADCGFA